MSILAPAILSKDPYELQEKIKLLESIPTLTDLHIDFCDGEFVQNKTFMPKELPALNSRFNVEAHMMVVHPEQYFSYLQHKGVNLVTLHYEAFSSIDLLIGAVENLRALGFQAGVGINPRTELSAFDGLADHIDVALVMSVHPGFQGSPFVSESLERVGALKRKFPKLKIQIDGGIKLENIKSAQVAGSDRIVVGSGVWHSPDPKKAINDLLLALK